MYINPVNNYIQQKYFPIFGINLSSPKLKFKEDDFYVCIKGYGHHSGWAKIVKQTAENAVKYIREHCNFEETLKRITIGITEANQLPLDLDKRNHTGILRTERDGWRFGSEWNHNWGLITRYSNNKYKTYTDKLDYTVNHPLKNPYDDIQLTRPEHDKNYHGKVIAHAHYKYIDNAFEHIEKIYNNLYEKYILNEVKNEDLSDVNNSVAEIRWILAHATPWERGSDAISNTFIRSIYKAIGIKATPLKRGISLDLEAYCTNLDDYKKNFETYFVKKPYVVE